ncbi:MAG: response regulator transcription factor [Atopobiaceae bacterium]|nr:response regulator transcription factor [Atopobiaceae bacterium]
MARILVVEDEPKIARFVELELTHEGYEVDKVADGRAGVETALAGDYDLILLDVLLPQLNGMEVLRRIRRESDVPVIMLTARDAVMDKVAGLDAGADDYITKPFAIEELLARIRVALKRRESASPAAEASMPPEPDHHVLSIRGVTLDVERHEVKVGDDPIELTNREFEVLKALMENRNVVMTRERLAQLACGYDFVGETNIIDVYIRHLRSKIDDRHGIKLISTVRGVGYVIRED